MQQKPFKIYSSSAGSGKTYTLTKEYLKLALKQDEPFYFRHILAITFTNDAANEMKERILAALRGFADPLSLPENKRAANQQLLETILQELTATSTQSQTLTETILRRRAGRTFSHILHDYSDFAVSTIDSFVNRLVGAFTEELDIPFNYEVTMEGDELVGNAVDRVLNRIGYEQEEILSEMIEAYALEITDEGKSWNGLPGNLADFGKNLLNEKVMEAMDRIRLLTLDDFRQIKATIDADSAGIQKIVSDLAVECLDALTASGIESRMMTGGKNGMFGYFDKHANGVERQMDKELTPTLLELERSDDWASKTAKTHQRETIQGLQPTLHQAFTLIEQQKGMFLMLQAITQHFYKLSVIHEISRELTRLKADKNQVLISDFNQALVRIILKEPVPFIYERLGEKYNHILIDEFQDTSILQWNNLLPLVENGLAKGHFSLIVGDAKQAIYGWRGGDMEQIVHLANKRFDILMSRHRDPDMLGIRYETIHYTLAQEHLNTNYRSTREIVEFNNEIFALLTGLHSEHRQLLADVYDAFAAQEVPSHAPTGGHVEIQFIDAAKEEDSESEILTAYQRRSFESVWRIIEDVTELGYSYSDIAVLCRSNTNGKEIANFLKNRGLRIISQDSLLLQNSPAVKLVTVCMQALNTPTDGLLRYEVLHLFYEYVLEETPQLTPTEWDEIRTHSTLTLLFRHIEERGYFLRPFQLQQSGLYEIGATLVETFRLADHYGQSPYVFRFLDLLLDFSSKQSNHLAEFLQYWERKKEKLCIHTPKGENAITVTSIHKSKGLEYPVVIVPFADWSMQPSPTDIWWMNLDAAQLTYNLPQLAKIPLRSAPVTPKKELMRTPLQGQYERDAEKLFIENMNLLYVALTRPTDRLYLLSKEYDFSKKSEKLNVSLLLHDYLDQKNLWETHRPHYILHEGTLKPRPKETPPEKDVLLVTHEPVADWHKKARLRRLASRMFDTETFEKTKDDAQRLCEALRQLEHSNQVELCLDRMEAEGTISEAERKKFRSSLQDLLADERLKPHFASTAGVKSVRDILCKHTLNLTPPDRVVVSGSTVTILNYIAHEPTEADEKSLNRYAKALQQMGYQSIEKLLVNTQILEVVEIGTLTV